MKVLQVKSTFKLMVDGTQFYINDIFVFNGGEVQIKLPQLPNKVNSIDVIANVRDANGVLSLILIKNAIDSLYPI